MPPTHPPRPLGGMARSSSPSGAANATASYTRNADEDSGDRRGLQPQQAPLLGARTCFTFPERRGVVGAYP